MADERPLDLSVIIITFNEEADLPGCLDSVKGLGAQVVVVDNSSRDRTVEVARGHGAEVHDHAFSGYAPQKQFALEQARRGWVLSIDADERVTPELVQELRTVLASPSPESALPAGFEIPFEVHYLGRNLRYGGLGSERHLRLFRRDGGSFVGGTIHEGVNVSGPIGRLSGKIRHTPYRDLDEHIAKSSLYTTLAARKRFEQGSRSNPFYLLVPPWNFFVRYIVRLGFLDGRQGFVYAVMAAFYAWTKYTKLAQLQDPKPL
jgi:glycosyltransferase involved in cell wall biosynthesis